MQGFQFEWPVYVSVCVLHACVCVRGRGACVYVSVRGACVYELATSLSALRIVFHFNFVNMYSISHCFINSNY